MNRLLVIRREPVATWSMKDAALPLSYGPNLKHSQADFGG